MDSGSGDPCARDADCATAGELCRFVINLGGDPAPHCTLPVAGQALFDEDCDDSTFFANDSVPDPPCADNVCFNSDCSSLCVDDNDCPAGRFCRQNSVGLGHAGNHTVNVCE